MVLLWTELRKLERKKVATRTAFCYNYSSNLGKDNNCGIYNERTERKIHAAVRNKRTAYH